MIGPRERTKRKEDIVCILGSGYAGLPLAKAFVIEKQ